jgi:hypothetical protein
MSILTYVSDGVGQAISRAREAYSDPAEAHLQRSNQERNSIYGKYWQYYNNEAFEELAQWQEYLNDKELYQYTRLLFNPVRRLVDFYAGRVYPGRLTVDAQRLPQGVPLAIPLADDTDPALAAAIGQTWQWANWQDGMRLYVRYGASAGNVGVEVVDDPSRGKIGYDVIWPSLIKDMTQDAYGNVKQYVMEYETLDEQGEPYLFRKEVDEISIRYFKDDEPFDAYGDGAVVFNTYGFVPFVWAKHKNLGGDNGATCFSGSVVKIDEVNGAASHLLDLIHKHADPAFVLWMSGQLAPAFKQPVDGEADENAFDPRLDSVVLKGEKDGKLDKLVGNLEVIEKAMPLLERLLDEIEADHPELSLYKELRAMSNVTGPGARAMIGDSIAPYDEACSNYDTQSQKLFQMGVAIGGHRANRGDGAWAFMTAQRAKFLPFSLDSYRNDELNVEIKPRQLLEMSEEELLALDNSRINTANNASGLLPIQDRIAMVKKGATPAELATMASKVAQEVGQTPDPFGQ